MTKDEALKLALEALNTAHLVVADDMLADEIQQAITAIKEALAQPEQERYFCQRCGKPVNLTTIHTCTPPRENT
jgi:late competence protein required for DNA uptake (superfamily II DNA/RNA helicase)